MSRARLDGLLRSSLRAMTAPVYPAPLRGGVRMDANTNLFGVNPAVTVVARRAGRLDLAQYPSGNSDALRDALARFWRIEHRSLVIGNGSDELFDLVTKAFLDPGDRIAFPVPSFVMYPFYARVNLGRPVAVPLVARPAGRGARGPESEVQSPGSEVQGRAFELDVDGLLAAKAKLIVIASPNSPTGNAFPEGEIERLVRRAPGLVVVDEAYAEFSGQNLIPWIRRFDNLLVTRTFSKAYGLAGLRIGYAVGAPALVDALLRVKPPFNVGGFSEAVAVEALCSRRFVDQGVRAVKRERKRVAAALAAMGAAVHPSDANFLLVELRCGAGTVAAMLRACGILVRSMTDVPGMERSIRVTLGPRAVNDRFLAELRRILR